MRAFIPEIVDTAVSAFLCGIDQEIIQLSFPASNGNTRDLTKTDGLVGWFAGLGWITRYAKERYVDTDPNPKSYEERKQLAMEPPDAGPELEEFGRILVERVRDVAIRANDCMFAPNASTPLARCWRREAETLGRDVFTRRVVLDITDATLALLRQVTYKEARTPAETRASWSDL